jgi:hypothetical protein
MQPTINPKLRDLLPLVLGLLLLVSLSSATDMLIAMFPMDFGDIRWRYSLLSTILTSATQTGLFIALFMAIGALSDRRMVVRVAALVAIAFGAIYLITLPFFGLDFVVARRLIAVNARHNFDMQWVKTTGYVAVLSIALLWCGIKGFRGTPNLHVAGKPREAGEGLIVGQG